MKIEKVVENFISEETTVRRCETIRYDWSQIKPLINYFKGEIQNICKSDVLNYILSEQKRNNANSTINKRIAMLKRLINYAINEEFITITKELQKVLNMKKLKAHSVPKHTLDNNELNNLLEYYDGLNEEAFQSFRLKAMISVCLSTGVRFNELINIKTANVNFTTGEIFIEYTKVEFPRIVLMSEETKTLIKRYIERFSSEYLFTDIKGNKLSMNALRCIFKRLSCKLNIKISPCGLRHTFAVKALENDADIESIRRLLGHTKLSTTQIYLAHITMDHVKDEFKQSNIFENRKKLIE